MWNGGLDRRWLVIQLSRWLWIFAFKRCLRLFVYRNVLTCSSIGQPLSSKSFCEDSPRPSRAEQSIMRTPMLPGRTARTPNGIKDGKTVIVDQGRSEIWLLTTYPTLLVARLQRRPCHRFRPILATLWPAVFSCTILVRCAACDHAY